LAQNGYYRNVFTSQLINTAIKGIEFELNNEFPQFSTVKLKEKILIRTEVLKNFTYESQILSPRLKVAEVRGKEIVSDIFSCLKKDGGWRLLPYDYQAIYQYFPSKNDKMRVICDFIAGMTDRYAIEFYGRLKSEDPATIFKPF
jgi:dGTPase